jgi:2-haloacid dehalogenase
MIKILEESLMTTAVKALIFDVFGTVVDWRSSLIADLTAFGAARGVDLDWVELVDDWRGDYQAAMDRVRKGAIGWTNLEGLYRDSLVALLEKRGVTGFSEADIEHINKVWDRLHGWPDSVAGLTRLKRRFAIATLSNGSVAQLMNMAKFASLPWDMLFSAELFQAYKPDPKTYLGACGLLRLAPSEVMMVAAHNYDLKAAKGFGLRTGFIARPTEYGPRQTHDFGPEGEWDVNAASMTELADKLGC